MSSLYLVSTPIGNLQDITLRAIETFKIADLVFAEDTRVTKKLFSHLGIKKKIHLLNEQNENKVTEKILNVEVNPQSKIYCNINDVEGARKKYNITNETKNIICGISASGPTKRWDINNYIRLFEELNKKYKSNFFLAGGLKDEDLIKRVINSNIGKNCLSFSKMNLSEAIPIIAASQYYIGNDTGWGHIASGLGLKSLFLFMDSPPSAYGVYSKNITIICPEGLTVENTGHNTRGKDLISFNDVLKKSIELIN